MLRYEWILVLPLIGIQVETNWKIEFGTMIQTATRIVLVFAFATGTVSAACTPDCVSCKNSTCMTCQSSYYLVDGNCLPCPENCPTCDSYNDCTSCEPYNWGLTARCSYSCSTKCLNRECHDDNGYCTGCKTGTYGPQCQQNCSLCEDGQCELRKCTLGCKSGYFEYTTSTETLCYNCPADCKVCNRSHVCNVCNDGYHVHEFLSSGNIYVYCVQCPLEKSCKTCRVQSNNVVCTTCYDGFDLDGNYCKHRVANESSCSSGCSGTCDENEICLGSCNTGWTGKQCRHPCSKQCFSCNKTNANLCEECNGDFYTNTCNIHCNTTCLKVNGQTSCRLHDGYCLHGCERNFWGPFCNQSCSDKCFDDGLAGVCERDNGTCKQGCTGGNYGDICETSMSAKPREGFTKSFSDLDLSTTSNAEISEHRQGRDSSSNKTSFVTGYLSGIGTSLGAFAVLITLYLIRRRYIAKKSKTYSEHSRRSEVTTNDASQAQGGYVAETTMSEINNYESLRENRNIDTFYSELEKPSSQQSESYYNISIAK